MAPHPVNSIMKNAPSIAFEAFANLAVQYGETCAEFIQRIAIMRGLFIWDDTNGNLCAGAADNGVVADLVEGQNILRATLDVEQSTVPMSVWKNDRAATRHRQQLGHRAQYRKLPPIQAIHRTGLACLWARAPRRCGQIWRRGVNWDQAITAQTELRVAVTVVGWKKDDGTIVGNGDGVTLLSPMLFPDAESAVTLYAQSVVYEARRKRHNDGR